MQQMCLRVCVKFSETFDANVNFEQSAGTLNSLCVGPPRKLLSKVVPESA